AIAKISEQREALVRNRRDEKILPTVVIHVSCVYAHGTEGLAVVVKCDARLQSHFLKSPTALISKQEIRGGIVGDKNVQQAVIVEVKETDSHPFANVGAYSGALRYVSEGPVTVVVIELVRQSGVVLGMAIGAGLTGGACRFPL